MKFKICAMLLLLVMGGSSSAQQFHGPPALLAFMTSEFYPTGNLGGLAGADANCQRLADNAGIDGTYKAWLSDSNTDAATRFEGSIKYLPYVRVDGVKVADDWDDLTDGNIDVTITVFENGNATGAGAFSPWTGTNTDGTKDEGGRFCNDWTSSSVDVQALWGRWVNTDSLWTDAGPGQCNGWRAPDNTRLDPHPLYCLEYRLPPPQLPALSPWGLIIAILALGLLGVTAVRGRT